MEPYRTRVEDVKAYFESLPHYPLLIDRGEIIGPEIEEMVWRTYIGLKRGMVPELTSGGLGASYYLKDLSNNKVSVFKPRDGERNAENNPRRSRLGEEGGGQAPGEFSKTGIKPGTGSAREIAAYYLDHPNKDTRRKGLTSTGDELMGFAGVPPTIFIRCLHPVFTYNPDPPGYEYKMENYKVGSLQMFVKSLGTCENRGFKGYSMEDVHKISVFDIRLANTDRNDGNMLFYEKDEDGIKVEGLVPIDHGGCFPKNFDGGCIFEWLFWSQAEKPYSQEIIDYINSINVYEDIALLKSHKFIFSDEYSRVLHISTMLLKKGVARRLTPQKIGMLMTIENFNTNKSVIKEIVEEAEAMKFGTEPEFLQNVSEIMDRRLPNLNQAA